MLAALIGDATSEWGTLFKRMTYKLKSLRTRRGGMKAGISFAARRMTLVYNTNYDIAPGIVPAADHPIRSFINLSRSDTAIGMAELGNTVEKLLDVNEAPTWRQAQSLLGITGKMAKQLAVDGSPLPWPQMESRPLDWSDPNEVVGPLTDIKIPILDTSLNQGKEADEPE